MGMLLARSQGMVSPTGCFQAQHQVLSKALELENSPSGRLCLIFRGVNPTFHS